MMSCISNYIPVFGYNKHCPGEANDTPRNSKQHWSKDIESLPNDSPSQYVVLKQVGAAKHARKYANNV